MKRPRIAVVEWHDAFVDGGAPVFEDEVKYKPAVRETVGWLIYDEADGIGLAATIDGVNEKAAYQDTSWIPRGCVVKRRLLPGPK